MVKTRKPMKAHMVDFFDGPGPKGLAGQKNEKPFQENDETNTTAAVQYLDPPW